VPAVRCRPLFRERLEGVVVVILGSQIPVGGADGPFAIQQQCRTEWRVELLSTVGTAPPVSRLAAGTIIMPDANTAYGSVYYASKPINVTRLLASTDETQSVVCNVPKAIGKAHKFAP
jgi:hypothetical protein